MRFYSPNVRASLTITRTPPHSHTHPGLLLEWTLASPLPNPVSREAVDLSSTPPLPPAASAPEANSPLLLIPPLRLTVGDLLTLFLTLAMNRSSELLPPVPLLC